MDTQQQLTERRSTVARLAFFLLLVLSIVSYCLPVPFLYGTTLTLTSMFVLLNLRVFGMTRGLLLAVLIYVIGIVFFKAPAISLLHILETAFVGLALKRYPNRLFGIAVCFWLFGGVPLYYVLHQMLTSADSQFTLTLVAILAFQSSLNALIAHAIHQYLPVRQWRKALQIPPPRTNFSQILYHLSFSIILLSFLCHITISSHASYKEALGHATMTASNIISQIETKWDLWSKNHSEESMQEWLESDEMQSLASNNMRSISWRITDSEDNLLAESRSLNQSQTNDATTQQRLTLEAIQLAPFSLFMAQPEPEKPLLFPKTWSTGSLQYSSHFGNHQAIVKVNLPLRLYEKRLFTGFFPYFQYLLGMSLIATGAIFLISQSLSGMLQRLAKVTRNLPAKLRNSHASQWPTSNVIEFHSLISNFRYMSNSLVHILQESSEREERMREQAARLEDSEERLHKLAYYDGLTGLPNRLSFKHVFEEIAEELSQPYKQIAVKLANINRFKQINDTLGHQAGDRILQRVAERLSKNAYAHCHVFHMGGDEFAFISLVPPDQPLTTIIDPLVAAFQEPFIVEGTPLYLSISLGISLYPQDGGNADTMMRAANVAMYHSKSQGDGKYYFFRQEQMSVAREQMLLENGLYKALIEQQLVLHYQPKVDATSKKLLGVEALIRWYHPELGAIPPDKFIPLAEAISLILELDAWVFREACNQHVKWRSMGKQVHISVNISARHFYQGNLLEMVSTILAETGADPSYLSLEITESAFMQNMELVIQTILQLQSLGIKTSLDDFGTGYSSLSQLHKLPISDVKLDRSFIKDISKDPTKSAIVKAIIEMVHSMDKRVIAEGVETELEEARCLQLGCDELQGYLYSKPLDSIELELQFLQQSKP